MQEDFISQVIFRKATELDLEFIVTTIIQAEKSGRGTISSCNIFHFTEEMYLSILRQTLLKDYEDYEYSLSGFIVAEFKGKPIGALGSWIEEENEVPSFMLKAKELVPNIPEEKKTETIKTLILIRGFNIKRDKHALQLEFAYVHEEFRRKKVFTNLILRSIKKHLDRNVMFNGVQAIMMKDNFKSFNAYKKLNFVITDERKATSVEISKLYPYDVKVSMMLDNKNIESLFKDNTI